MRWVLRGGSIVLAAGIPLLSGIPGALALLLVLPVAVECCRAAGERPACCAAIAAFCAGCCYAVPALALPALVWCGAGLGMSLLGGDEPRGRGLAWAALCTALLCGLLVWMNFHYEGQVFAGLAEDAVTWVNAQDNAGEMLLRCYQVGFSRLEGDMQPVVNLLGMLVMTQQVRLELLYSLRTTLEALLTSLLPQVIVFWVLATAVLTAALPDVVHRKGGRRGRLSPFGTWRLSASQRRCLNVLALGYFLPLLTGSAVVSLMGSLCAATFHCAYMLLGLAVMEGLTKQYGTARLLRRLWMAACLVLAPVVLVILGIADGAFDLRKLRRSTEDEGGV